MWRPDAERMVRVRLLGEGDEAESVWAEDLGPAFGEPQARRVRLCNVPILYSKPTYGDVVVVEPDEDGILIWDGGGRLPGEDDRAIEEDGGRWVMIVDFAPAPSSVDAQRAFAELVGAAKAAEIVVEGCYAPSARTPGRACLAVPNHLSIEGVLEWLCRGAGLQMKLKLVYPLDDA